MMGIIASNLLKIRNDSAIVVKNAITVVYLRTHFFSPKFYKTLDLIVMHIIT